MEQKASDQWLWKPSKILLGKYQTRHRYIVELAVEPVTALTKAWQELERERRAEDGTIHAGGVSLHFHKPGHIEVSSSGEDGVESLSWGINVLLAKALATVDPQAQVKLVEEHLELRHR
ncbi:MAG: hypothetical protein ACRCWS_07800 [Propionibacteriaceae bacterium]